jgi:hypothetical protein
MKSLAWHRGTFNDVRGYCGALKIADLAQQTNLKGGFCRNRVCLAIRNPCPMSAARITLCSAGRAGRRWVRGTRQRRGYSTPSGAQRCGNCGGSPIRTLNTSPADSFRYFVGVV